MRTEWKGSKKREGESVRRIERRSVKMRTGREREREKRKIQGEG